MIVEQINTEPSASGRNFAIPEGITIQRTNFNLKQATDISAAVKCPDCGSNMTGTECADCAKQTVL